MRFEQPEENAMPHIKLIPIVQRQFAPNRPQISPLPQFRPGPVDVPEDGVEEHSKFGTSFQQPFAYERAREKERKEFNWRKQFLQHASESRDVFIQSLHPSQAEILASKEKLEQMEKSANY
jgi:hypothetical protein